MTNLIFGGYSILNSLKNHNLLLKDFFINNKNNKKFYKYVKKNKI